MNRVPGAAQVVCEVDNARREPQRVVEQDYFGHVIESIADGRELGLEA